MKAAINIILTLLATAVVMLPAALFAASLPDPTRPADYAEAGEGKTQLTKELIDWDVRAIRSSKSGRNAIVNGKLVKVGDEIDSATIVAITSNTVVLSQDSKQMVLKLLPADVKKKHDN